MRLVGYGRVSTLAQKEEQTIDLQLQAIAEYANDNDHEVTTVFKDEGVSGSLQDRPGLAELFSYLDEHPETEGVIIYKLDRLARDLLVQETLIAQLAKCSVRLFSTKEPDLDGDDPSRKMIRQLFGAIAEYERSLITMRLSGGRIAKARRGGYSGGGVPLGCAVDDKDLVVDPARQAVVAEIFAMHRDGHSMSAIARHLNKQGTPPPKYGQQWWVGSVSYVLKNQIYSGRLIYKGNESVRQDLALPNR